MEHFFYDTNLSFFIMEHFFYDTNLSFFIMEHFLYDGTLSLLSNFNYWYFRMKSSKFPKKHLFFEEFVW